MTQELRVDAQCAVLEIGTGCGYQTAILCRLAKRVYTVERLGELSESAQANLSRLGVENVEFYVGDGSCGWPASKLPASGSFDRIMVTAAVPGIPEPLIGQLAEAGYIVAPVGGRGSQRLLNCQKRKGRLFESAVCDVRFVKLVGRYGFER
jgi:protein-L-isoaspartate(D-aspartate) O-methyltransferase